MDMSCGDTPLDATVHHIGTAVQRRLDEPFHSMDMKAWLAVHKGQANAYKLEMTAAHRELADTQLELIYKHVLYLIRHHLDQLCHSQLANVIDIIPRYSKLWGDFHQSAKHVNGLLNYVNKNHCSAGNSNSTSELGPPMIIKYAMQMWHERVFLAIKDQLISCVLDLVNKDRMGDCVDRSLICGVVQTLLLISEALECPLQLYQIDFEVEFIENLREHLRKTSAGWVQSHTLAEYLRAALQCVENETRRRKLYLPEFSEPKVQRALTECLIAEHRDYIVTGLPAFFEQHLVEDIANAHTLLLRVPPADGLDVLDTLLRTAAARQGEEAVARWRASATPGERPNVVEFVRALSEYVARFDRIVHDACGSSARFLAAMERGCAVGINAEKRVAHLVGAYSNMLLEKGRMKLGEEESIAAARDMVTILRLVRDKDVFCRFYQKMLAERLVHDRVKDMTLEERVITDLKNAIGFEYTSKLQEMFRDMLVNRQINEQFREYAARKELAQVPRVFALKHGVWPFKVEEDIVLPHAVATAYAEYTHYYTDSTCLGYNNKKLVWLHMHSRAELQTTYLKKKYTFVLNMYQLSMMYKFNTSDRETWTLRELREATRIPELLIRPTVASLLKPRILSVSPPLPAEVGGRKLDVFQVAGYQQLNESHTLTLNRKFALKKLRFLVRFPRVAEVVSDHEIEAERKMLIQIFLVRTMKARKRARLADIIDDVVNQLHSKFVAKPRMIKKELEVLINKEYVKRTEEKGVFEYLP